MLLLRRSALSVENGEYLLLDHGEEMPIPSRVGSKCLYQYSVLYSRLARDLVLSAAPENLAVDWGPVEPQFPWPQPR